MPVTMSMNKTSPPRSPTYMHPSKSMYKPPSPDPAEVLAAAKANELLNLRSANISYILAQRSEAGKEFANKSAIKLPEANPRIDELHKELGIDKVVIVKCPFEIDTTPGGQWHNPLLTQSVEGGGTATAASPPPTVIPGHSKCHGCLEVNPKHTRNLFSHTRWKIDNNRAQSCRKHKQIGESTR